jgi:hypothetical protein
LPGKNGGAQKAWVENLAEGSRNWTQLTVWGWKIHWINGNIMGKSWGNHGKIMENHGKIMGKSWDMYDMMGNSHGKWRCCMI